MMNLRVAMPSGEDDGRWWVVVATGSGQERQPQQQRQQLTGEVQSSAASKRIGQRVADMVEPQKRRALQELRTASSRPARTTRETTAAEVATNAHEQEVAQRPQPRPQTVVVAGAKRVHPEVQKELQHMQHATTVPPLGRCWVASMIAQTDPDIPSGRLDKEALRAWGPCMGICIRV